VTRYLIAVAIVVALSAAIAGMVMRHRRKIQNQPFTLSGAQLTEFT